MDIHELDSTDPWDWPAEASEVIMNALGNSEASEEDRSLAIHLAGSFEVINDELANELMEIVKNPDEAPEVRAQAAIAFGPALEYSESCDWDGLDEAIISEDTYSEMRKTLHEVYLDASAPKLVRRRALEGAVRAPEDWQKDAIRAAYASDDPDWRLTAVFGMSFAAGFDAEIMDALGSDDAQMRCEAVLAAGENSVEAAWPYVRGLLEGGTPEKDLLLAAISAAPHINREETLDLLAEYEHVQDEEIAGAVAEALEAVSVLEALTEAFDEGEEWDAEYEDDEFEDEDELDEDED